jgi:ABC-type sugar transport system permease subunit
MKDEGWRSILHVPSSILPFLFLFLFFTLYPLFLSLRLSFYQTLGRHERFVGLANYHHLIHDRLFWLALLNTVAFTVLFISIQLPCSLGLALLLNSRRVRLRGLFRFAFFSTYLVGNVFVAIVFAMILSARSGLLNRALSALRGSPVVIDWLGEPLLAMPSVLLAALWLTIGYAMIYFLAALQGVDVELYDAARVDGAGRWGRFWHITLPAIRPILSFMVLVGAISSLQLFELPWVLFQSSAGPNSAGLTLVMYLYIHGWAAGDLGYAAAIGWAIFLVSGIFAFKGLTSAKNA